MPAALPGMGHPFRAPLRAVTRQARYAPPASSRRTRIQAHGTRGPPVHAGSPLSGAGPRHTRAVPGLMAPRSRLVPELPLAGFGFLTHFACEMLQVPWFAGMVEASHGTVVWLCTRATGGDVVILLMGFWLGLVVAGHRPWIVPLHRGPAVVMIASGIAVTLVLEWLATGPLERWRYAEAMPVIPSLGVGLAPLAQWLLLPPLILWLARHHLAGRTALVRPLMSRDAVPIVAGPPVALLPVAVMLAAVRGARITSPRRRGRGCTRAPVARRGSGTRWRMPAPSRGRAALATRERETVRPQPGGRPDSTIC